MTGYLSAAEAGAIERRIASIEAAHGVQVVTAIVGRSDAYPEIRWKAFAMGAAVAALAVVVLDALRPGWTGAGTTLIDAVAILGVAAANALAAQFVPAYGRRFVRANRAEAEVRQYAEGMFLARGLFTTDARSAVLLLASLFEHRVVVHADIGFDGRLTPADWQGVVAAMTPPMRRGERAQALGEGLTALERLLVARGFVATVAASQALPDQTVEERGA